MKILMATWTWYPIGGDWTYVANLKRLYEDHGHEVIPFSTISDQNIPSEYNNYFVKSTNYKELNKKKNPINAIQAARNSIVSMDALDKIEQLIADHQIDFAHFHIIQHWVTPAIIWKLKKANIPIVWTLHEYKLICPENTFVSNGTVCEKCFDKKFYNCALNKCKKNSFGASLLASLDAYFYSFTNTYSKVDYFLCPSQFLLEKYKQFKFPESKLLLTNYCYDIKMLDEQHDQLSKQAAANKSEKYILYVGRIEKVKGIKTLIDAVAGTDMVLKLAGTGNLLDEVTQYVKDNKLTNIEFIGFQDKTSVFKLTMDSLCVTCPSEWYENYPFSVIESMLLHKAVVGGRIGGIPELVLDGQTGFLFEPGNHIELREKLLTLWNNPALAEQYGKNGREYAYSKVNFDTHWAILEDIIKRLPIKQYA